MKNLAVYYFSILLPIPLLYLSAKYDAITFSFLLMLYVLYRGFTDGKRLIEKKIIKKDEFWKAFIPLYTSKHFRELYFEA